jgi:hypothetical protein
LDLFPNLKSIVISSPLPIYYEELTFILKSKIFYKDENSEEILLKTIFNIENFLQTFECLSELSSREINNLIINENIQSLTLMKRIFFILTNFRKQFSSSLIYLSMNLNNIQIKEFQFNGFILKQQLLKSMIQLKSFHLYAKFDQQLIDVEDILSTFENQFWFHTRNLFVHYTSQNSNRLL